MPGSNTAWEAIRARISEAGRKTVRVGVIGAQADALHGADGTTNGEIALWMEFGTEHVPERSFIRATLRDPAVRAKARVLQARIAKAVIEGRMTAERAHGLIGAFWASAIQSTIVDDKVGPALRPATVARKGNAKVLVDSGQLARSISWVVVP